MKGRIFLFGRSGFVGGFLRSRFNAEGQYTLKAFDSKECNLLSPADIGRAIVDLNEDDIIILAAAKTRTKDNSLAVMSQNIEMVGNLVEEINKKVSKLKQFFYLSSTDVFGSLDKNMPKDVAIHESSPMQPDDYYGLSKMTTEIMLKQQDVLKGRLTILRFPGIFGPGDKGISVIARLIEQAKQGRINIFGDGSDRREYIYIEDLFQVIKRIIESNSSQELNVVSGTSYSLKTIAQMIQENVNTSCEIKYTARIEDHNIRWKNMKFDNHRLRQVFPDIVLHDLSTAIKEYLSTYQYQNEELSLA